MCTFAQPRWHRQSHAEECSAMSRSAAVTRNILEFFSLRFTTFVYQPLAEVTISSAKKCCFPKSFGRVSQRFVFLLLPNLATVFKGGKKKQPDKSMREETNSDLILHFFPKTCQSLPSTTNTIRMGSLGGKNKQRCAYPKIRPCFIQEATCDTNSRFLLKIICHLT